MPLQYTAEEAIPSQLAIKEEEEEEIVEVSDSKDNFEVFNQPRSLEVPTGDLSHISPAQVSHSQEDSTILDTMVLQHKTSTSLQDLLESQIVGNVPEKVAQTKPPTPPFTQALHPDLVDKKRKRDPKGKEVLEKGKAISLRWLSPRR